MRVAVVAGPDPGHAFPALALCLKFLAAGDTPTLLTGTEWLDTARAAGVDAAELVGLDPTDEDDDEDSGAKIHRRGARMAVLYLPSKGLPPVGSGLAPGRGLRGRLRDAVFRALSARSVRNGVQQRTAARA